MKVKLGPADSIKHLSHEVAKESKADVFFYSGGIEEPSDYLLVGKARRLKRHDNAVLILTTAGGSADSAYRMMRSLRSLYADGRIILYIPSFCKSAGTLMAVGADELVMSDIAELGPLDVQVRKPDEIGEYSSGLTPLQALGALRTEAFNFFEEHFLNIRERSGRQITAKTSAEIAVKLTVGAFQPIYGQLDPMRLSETQRAMMIAWEYGLRLVCGNIDRHGLGRLISDYPSHGFIIDRHEASEIFNRVRRPSENERKLSSALIQSRLMDEGMNGLSPIVMVLSSETCEVDPDNPWEGIEYEDDSKDKPTGDPRKSKPGSRKTPVSGKQKSAKPNRITKQSEHEIGESNGKNDSLGGS